MAEVKLTKNELRAQQRKLAQLQLYLPTLQLKKAMLQVEVNEAKLEIERCQGKYDEAHASVDAFSPVLTDPTPYNPALAAKITEIRKRYENIAGVEVPYFEGISFVEPDYPLFETPAWVDSAIIHMRGLAETWIKIKIAEEKKQALEKELRTVSIRVNLFEKILIPRAIANIKKIKVFLGDQQLAAVSQAKVAKGKIEEKKKLLRESKALGKVGTHAG